MASDNMTAARRWRPRASAALAENGSDNNYGLHNRDGAEATLRGGSFTGRGGMIACGIYNADSGTWLEAESVSSRWPRAAVTAALACTIGMARR